MDGSTLRQLRRHGSSCNHQLVISFTTSLLLLRISSNISDSRSGKWCSKSHSGMTSLSDLIISRKPRRLIKSSPLLALLSRMLLISFPCVRSFDFGLFASRSHCQILVKYIPAWFPGATFKHQAAKWRLELDRLVHTPYKMVRAQFVSKLPLFSSYRSLTIWF